MYKPESLILKNIKNKDLLLDKSQRNSLGYDKVSCLISDLKVAKIYGVKFFGVTGASGSGKDTFVDQAVNFSFTGIGKVHHIRFGDVMKDMAYELGMVPYDRKYYELNREARFEILPNGKTALDAWISLDIIRTYNPFIFIEKSLRYLVKDSNLGDSDMVIFSGMRTEAGLKVVEALSPEGMIRVVRDGHVPPEGAVLDELQVQWPVNSFMRNSGTLEEFKENSIKEWKVLINRPS
jgi:hypothetical protein